uniref:DUF4283 domain-containing protein n=1 Tax=Cannabis sativa TaxID=3483 RepID=A0A803P935_CANSA
MVSNSSLKQSLEDYCANLTLEEEVQGGNENQLASLWKSGMGMYVKQLESNLFLFQFYHDVDIQRVIEGGSWTCNRQYLILKRLKEGDNPCLNNLNKLDMKSQGKKGFMELKLDMSKAYDRIEWTFLEAILLKMGFHWNWVALILSSVQSVQYHIIHGVLRQPMILIIGTMKLWDYSVKNAYKLLQLINGRCSSVTNFSLWRIWSLKIPAKVSVFLWRPCCNNLPTTVNLIGKHVDVPAVYSFFVRLKGKLWTMFLWIVHLLTYASLILIEGFFEPLIAESIGLKEVLSGMKTTNYDEVVLKTDYQVLVNVIHITVTMSSPFGLPDADCRSYSRGLVPTDLQAIIIANLL